MMPLKTSVMLPYLTYITYKYRAEIANSQAKISHIFENVEIVPSSLFGIHRHR